MDVVNKFTDAMIANPYMAAPLLALLLGVCGMYPVPASGAAFGLAHIFDNFWYYVDLLKEFVFRKAKEGVDAARNAAKATLVPMVTAMFGEQAGAMVNSLIDNAHAIASQLIAGGEGMTDQIIDFLKQYFMYIVLAFVAYRMLR